MLGVDLGGTLPRIHPLGHAAIERETPTSRDWIGAAATHLFATGSHDSIHLELPRGLSGWDVDLAFADAATVVVTTSGTRHPEPSQEVGIQFDQGYDTGDLRTGHCTTIEDVTTEAAPLLPDS